MDDSTDRRTGTTRRTLVRGAAWSVPVVAVAATAPAFAASPCSTRYTYKLDWGTTSYTRSTYRSSSAVVASGDSSPVTVSFASVSYSDDVVNNGALSKNQPDPTRNLTVPANTGTGTTADPVVSSLGGRAGERGVMLYHASSTSGRGNRQEVTISFSRPVRGLDFFITDVDTILTPAYSDRVELTSVPSVLPPTRTQTLDGITGSGIQGDPWLRTADSNVSENAGGAQVRVVYPSTVDVSSIKVTYWNASGGAQYHRVFIGDLSFTAVGC